MTDLIFLFLLAAFIIYKLIQSLGKENDDIKKYTNKKIEPIINSLRNEMKKARNANFEIISTMEASLPDKIRKVFEEIRLIEHDFTAEKFINGAKKAFEIILIAFNEGKVEILKELLEDSIYKKFLVAIKERESFNSKLKHEVILIGIKNVEILDANIEKKAISIKISVESEQIKFVKNETGNIVKGSKKEILQLCDVWTFARVMKSKNSWKLIKTGTQ